MAMWRYCLFLMPGAAANKDTKLICCSHATRQTPATAGRQDEEGKYKLVE